MTRWQLQDAKARFSDLVKKAATEGPQEITVHGKPAAVLVSAAEFAKLTGKKKKKESLVDFLMRSPLKGVELDLTRSRDVTDRPVHFGDDSE